MTNIEKNLVLEYQMTFPELLQYDIDGVSTFNPLMPLLFSMFMSGSSFSNTNYLSFQIEPGCYDSSRVNPQVYSDILPT